MKIENNGTPPVSPKRTDGVSAAGKKYPYQGTVNGTQGKDRVEVTEDARLLSKARAAALDKTQDVDAERIEMLRQQVQNGNYQIPVEELAKRLVARRSLWSANGDEG